MLYVKSLYPYLTDEYIKENQQFNSTYDVANNITDVDILLQKQLNDDADLLLPIDSTGWRISDIEAVNTATDPRYQNILLQRFKQLGVNPDTTGLSDEQLLQLVVSRNLSNTDLSAMAQELIDAHSDYQSSMTLSDPLPAADPLPATE